MGFRVTVLAFDVYGFKLQVVVIHVHIFEVLVLSSAFPSKWSLVAIVIVMVTNPFSADVDRCNLIHI